MKNSLIAPVLVFTGAVAFAVGNVCAARSASTTNCEPATTAAAPASPQTVTLAEGGSFALSGTLTSATAVERPCELIVFENGHSRLILIDPAGTTLGNAHVSGTVSASGNPLGYSCSIVLKYTTP
jgi:hypothetical protein